MNLFSESVVDQSLTDSALWLESNYTTEHIY